MSYQFCKHYFYRCCQVQAVGHLSIAQKLANFSLKKCGFHPPFVVLEKHSINRCQSGDRCLFMRFKHELQVADSKTHSG